MRILNSEAVADLTDLVKSALICQHLNLGFSLGEDDAGEPIVADTDSVIGGLQIAFEIAELPWPVITNVDVAEFAEVNGIQLQ